MKSESRLAISSGKKASGAISCARRAPVAAATESDRLRAALHDGLGQILTSISFLASSLRQKLAARDLPEEGEAAEILSLATRAISETQALVREQESTHTTYENNGP